jgi:alpha-beta hydrolase superfamily lysophospholipase
MKHEDGHFPGHGGTSLYWQSWSPDDTPGAVMLLVHGHGEYSGRYPYHVQRLTADGIAVYALDLRGHGQSPGQRGHIDSIGDYRGDLGAFKRLVEVKRPGIPLFLYGHSMGSVVVLDFALRDPGGLTGLITSGVGLEPKGVAPWWKVLMAKILSRIWPTKSLDLDVEGKDLTRDPAEILDYDNDPVIHHKISARWGDEMLKANKWIKARPGDVRLPLFMQHGGADPVNLPSGSQNFIASVTYADASLKIYPGNLHNIHADLDKGKVLTDLADWIKARA